MVDLEGVDDDDDVLDDDLSSCSDAAGLKLTVMAMVCS